MDVLKGKTVTLGLLRREDCRTLCENNEGLPREERN